MERPRSRISNDSTTVHLPEKTNFAVCRRAPAAANPLATTALRGIRCSLWRPRDAYPIGDWGMDPWIPGPSQHAYDWGVLDPVSFRGVDGIRRTPCSSVITSSWCNASTHAANHPAFRSVVMFQAGNVEFMRYSTQSLLFQK